MRLNTIDIVILLVYFAAMVAVGIYVTRRASRNLDSYFLGGKEMPWWLLGISNASAMWDVTGTMWFVYILFTYGMKAVFLPWLWPTFNQIFEAIYLSRWVRSSNARTGAEWITTRFGAGRGGELSKAVIVVFALINVVGFVSYNFQGMGKFCEVFLDPFFKETFGIDPTPAAYAITIMTVTAVYVVLGGMLSVVLTDFTQFILMVISGFVIGGIALASVPAGAHLGVVPADWSNIFFGWDIALDWSRTLPALNAKIASDGYTPIFSLFFLVMFSKGVAVSLAGVAPNYDMQRVLAAKTPKEASLMSAIVSVCLVPRWVMIGGITLLGLVYVTPELNKMGKDIDFELVLPLVINRFLPAGLTGILLAGLMSSFMASFSATVNAGAAYLVNDLYKNYLHPSASNRTLIFASYLGSALILAAGIVIGGYVSSITEITLWIVAGLYGGYTASNVLKWYWWRLNGYGYFWGMLIGIVAAMLLPVVKKQFALEFNDVYAFPVIVFCSFIGCVAGSLLTAPVEAETLKSFYRSVRPWGFWKPVYEMIKADDAGVEPNRDMARDLSNCAVGIVWQLMLVTIPLYVIFRNLTAVLICGGILVATSVFLKIRWYNHLASDATIADASRSSRAAAANFVG
ncbi:MAG: Na+:solute symporter [Acidobacteria bacterium]|nr:Na+:solute symporter [Acidobacteriota bacterium]